MNKKILKSRMTENYSEILTSMTEVEQAWAEKFEEMEYEIERGHSKTATCIAKQLNPAVSEDTLKRIKEDVDTKVRCNPVAVESEKLRAKRNQRKTDATRPGETYDYSDWVRQRFAVDPETGEEYELAVTLSAEDALIEALDAARAHNVSLDEFINNPKYHTPDRKPGRPKKLEIV